MKVVMFAMLVVVVARFGVSAAGSSALDWLSVTGFGALVTLIAISPPRPWSLRGKVFLGAALAGVALHWWADVSADPTDAWPAADLLAIGCWVVAALTIWPERARWTRSNALRRDPGGAATS